MRPWKADSADVGWMGETRQGERGALHAPPNRPIVLGLAVGHVKIGLATQSIIVSS